MNTGTGLREIIINSDKAVHLAFRKNEIIFKENEEPRGIYCIESGSVKVCRIEASGRERILYLATCGEILGLRSVVDEHPNFNSAVSISETSAVYIPLKDFMNLMESHNTYKLLVMKSLCSRINSMEEHIMRVNEKVSNQRLAETLIMLIDKYGLNNSNALNVNLTLDELANFTCVSKSYMKKIVADFSHRGIISLSNKSIRILDLPQLKSNFAA